MCALICALPIHLSAQTFNPVSPALGFNVFARNNVTLQAGDTHGPLAMGGNLVLNGNTIMSMNTTGTYPNGAGNNDNYGLVIAGRVIFTSGNTSTLNKGILRIGDTTGAQLWYRDNNNNPTNLQVTSGGYNSNPRVQLQRVQPDSATLPHNINFAQAFSQMITYSNYISGYNNSTACNSMLNRITIPASNNPHISLSDTKVNYISLTTAQLTDLNNQGSIIFDDAPSAARIVVINVEGTGSYSFSPPNFGGISEPDGRFILWNFHGVTSLTLTGGNSVYGTIYAPLAGINKTGANNSNGQVIGQSVAIACCEIHYYPFEGNLPQCQAGLPLPMDGIALTATEKNNSIQVSWDVYNESNISNYTLEKSTDGSNYTAVTTVTAKAAAGTNQYSVTDDKPVASQVYYRVLSAETNGNRTYSNTVLVKLQAGISAINAGPNPFTDHIDINLSIPYETDLVTELKDLTGKTVYSRTLHLAKGAAHCSADGLDNLAPGFYILQIRNTDGSIAASAKMVK